MSLKAALAEMFAKPEELIRPLKHKNRNGYTVVVEDEGRVREHLQPRGQRLRGQGRPRVRHGRRTRTVTNSSG